MKKITLVKIILILALVFPFSGHTLEVEEEEILLRPRVPPGAAPIYLEQESITAFFEVTDIDEYKKLIPSIFSMPERPVCRVEVVNFYKMESRPPYLEAAVTILVKFKNPTTGEEMLAWHFLGLSVTNEQALWGRISGFPKVLRKVTLESDANKYLGISYARDGNTPTLKLTLELKKGKPTRDEKRFLDFVSPIPLLTIHTNIIPSAMHGKVINRGVVGGGQYKIYELETVAPRIWNIEFGDCSIEYPNDPNNYLARLRIGKCITGYWLKQKLRYKIPYKEE